MRKFFLPQSRINACLSDFLADSAKISLALFPRPWFYLNRQHDAGETKNKSSDKMKNFTVTTTAGTSAKVIIAKSKRNARTIYSNLTGCGFRNCKASL